MQVHILWKFIDEPWGGGNQFLKALRQQFIKTGVYTDSPAAADIILFNSHQFQKKVVKLKLKYPKKIFVHRVDGPLFQTRGEAGKVTDTKIFFCNDLIADGTIFQSTWSRKKSYQQGMKKNLFETCIINAPDPEIFFPKRPFPNKKHTNRKIRLITTTWSSNPRKGFDIYHYLDKHLDFSRFSMTFIGNTDKSFTNIAVHTPLPSKDIGHALRKHDIFIAASTGEPCSNSFLEALHCGLPAIARNNSSYPEILCHNGLLFNGTHDILDKIDNLSKNLDQYCPPNYLPRLDQVANLYYLFFKRLDQSVQSKEYLPKKISFPKYCHSRILLKKR